MIKKFALGLFVSLLTISLAQAQIPGSITINSPTGNLVWNAGVASNGIISGRVTSSNTYLQVDARLISTLNNNNFYSVGSGAPTPSGVFSMGVSVPANVPTGTYQLELSTQPAGLTKIYAGTVSVVNTTSSDIDVRVTNPPGGDQWPPSGGSQYNGGQFTTGTQINLTWQTTNIPANALMLIRLRSFNTWNAVGPVIGNPVTSPNDGNQSILLLPNITPGNYYYEIAPALAVGGVTVFPGKSGVFFINPPAGDTTPPTVSVTSPLDNATISGNVQVNTTASDNSGFVKEVTFDLLDEFGNRALPNPPIVSGLPIVDSSQPFSWSFDTRNYPDGDYQLGVQATDWVGLKSIVDFVPVQIFNPTAPAIVVDVPSSSTSWPAGSSQSVSWHLIGPSVTVSSLTAWLQDTQGNPLGSSIGTVQNPTTGSFLVNIPATVPAGQYKIAIGGNSNGQGITTGVSEIFNITAGAIQPPPVIPPAPGSVGSEKLIGYAWSSNIGWIGFDSSSGGPKWDDSHGVRINNGSFNGFAWSPALGWINFGPTSGYPEAPAHGAQFGPTVGATTTITGWARACSVFQGACDGTSPLRSTADRGNWDGWIKMNGTWSNGVKIKADATTGVRNLVGYAWGSNNLGWVSFCDEANPNNYCVSLLSTQTPPIQQMYELRTGTHTQSTGSGSVTVSPSGSPCVVASAGCQRYTAGTVITVTASPNSSSVLGSPVWPASLISACATASSGNCTTSPTFTFSKSPSIQSAFANFDEVDNCTPGTPGCGGGGTNYTVTVDMVENNTAQGRVLATSPLSTLNCVDDCAYSYSSGTNVTLIRIPLTTNAPGTVFTGWGGDCSGMTACNLGTLNSNKNVIANFDRFLLNLTVNNASIGVEKVTGPNGIDCNSNPVSNQAGCSKTYTSATSVTLTAHPGTNRSVTWSGAGSACSGTTCVVTVDGVKDVIATFGQVSTSGINFEVSPIIQLTQYTPNYSSPIDIEVFGNITNVSFCVRNIISTVNNKSFYDIMKENGCSEGKYPTCLFVTPVSGGPNQFSEGKCHLSDLDTVPFSEIGPDGKGTLSIKASRACAVPLKAASPYEVQIDVCSERGGINDGNIRSTQLNFVPTGGCPGDC